MTLSLEGSVIPGRAQLRDMSLLPLKKSLLLTTDFPPQIGGIGSLLFNLYRQFDLTQMTLVAPECADARDFDATQSYSAVRVPNAWNIPAVRGAFQVWQTYRLAEKLVSENPALILHCGHVNSALAARKLKRRYGTRYLVWTYGLEVMDEWLRSSIVPALQEADIILTISEFTRAFLTSVGVSESRMVKILPGTDPARFRPGLNCEALARRMGVWGRPTLLTVARIVKANRYKGHDVVIRSLPKIVEAIPGVVYLVVGGGDDLAYLDSVSRESGVRQHVIFAGCVSEAELPLLYNACDVFIMNSREERSRRGVLAEGFGLALLEAAACGKPVVAGRSGGMPDAVQDGVSGLLVNPRDSSQVSAAVIRLLREPCLANQLGKNGRKWVETEMNWGRSAADFVRELPRLGNSVPLECQLEQPGGNRQSIQFRLTDS
jgi:phosphatidyl-myo-inositol dimannoside synthase